jgi:hypothetical protein
MPTNSVPEADPMTQKNYRMKWRLGWGSLADFTHCRKISVTRPPPGDMLAP